MTLGGMRYFWGVDGRFSVRCMFSCGSLEGSEGGCKASCIAVFRDGLVRASKDGKE